jgi:hypothetical protein
LLGALWRPDAPSARRAVCLGLVRRRWRRCLLRGRARPPRPLRSAVGRTNPPSADRWSERPPPGRVLGRPAAPPGHCAAGPRRTGPCSARRHRPDAASAQHHAQQKRLATAAPRSRRPRSDTAPDPARQTGPPKDRTGDRALVEPPQPDRPAVREGRSFRLGRPHLREGPSDRPRPDSTAPPSDPPPAGRAPRLTRAPAPSDRPHAPLRAANARATRSSASAINTAATRGLRRPTPRQRPPKRTPHPPAAHPRDAGATKAPPEGDTRRWVNPTDPPAAQRPPNKDRACATQTQTNPPATRTASCQPPLTTHRQSHLPSSIWRTSEAASATSTRRQRHTETTRHLAAPQQRLGPRRPRRRVQDATLVCSSRKTFFYFF